jgi:hypothetical protein
MRIVGWQLWVDGCRTLNGRDRGQKQTLTASSKSPIGLHHFLRPVFFGASPLKNLYSQSPNRR